MVALVSTVAYLGLEARSVEVQCQIAPGLPRFNVVGLPDKAVNESRERVIAALAAISIPAYNDYTTRSRVSQAIAESQPLKQQVEAIRVGGERCPGNGEDGIGTPESYAGTYVTRATVGEFDDGTCGFELEFGNTGNAQIDGRKLWWDLGSDNSEWHCSSEIDDKYLPLDCRG